MPGKKRQTAAEQKAELAHRHGPRPTKAGAESAIVSLLKRRWDRRTQFGKEAWAVIERVRALEGVSYAELEALGIHALLQIEHAHKKKEMNADQYARAVPKMIEVLRRAKDSRRIDEMATAPGTLKVAAVSVDEVRQLVVQGVMEQLRELGHDAAAADLAGGLIIDVTPLDDDDADGPGDIVPIE